MILPMHLKKQMTNRSLLETAGMTANGKYKWGDLASQWNEHPLCDGNGVYRKLPFHLEAYFEKFKHSVESPEKYDKVLRDFTRLLRYGKGSDGMEPVVGNPLPSIPSAPLPVPTHGPFISLEDATTILPAQQVCNDFLAPAFANSNMAPM